MNNFISRHWVKINAAFYVFVFISIVMTASTYLNRAHMNNWNTADWLINYQGGFIRRGLLGEIIFRIGALTQLDIVQMVTFLQTSLYALLLYVTFRMSKAIRPTVVNAALIFSPAFMLFSVNDQEGGFKKELMLLTLLSVHSLYLSQLKQKPSNGYLLFLCISFVFMVMSHEMLVAFLPYFACGLYIQNKNLDRSELLKYAALMLPATVIAGVIILFFKGDSTAVERICTSLGSQAPLDCQTNRVFENFNDSVGAISFLNKSFSFGFHVVINANPLKSLITNAIALALAMAPIFYLLRNSAAAKRYKYLPLFPLLSLITTLPLLLVVGDYGRLIYIHAACLTYVVLQILNAHEEPLEAQKPQWTSNYAWVLCLFFILGWRVVHHHAVPSKEFTPIKIYKTLTS